MPDPLSAVTTLRKNSMGTTGETIVLSVGLAQATPGWPERVMIGENYPEQIQALQATDRQIVLFGLEAEAPAWAETFKPLGRSVELVAVPLQAPRLQKPGHCREELTTIRHYLGTGAVVFGYDMVSEAEKSEAAEQGKQIRGEHGDSFGLASRLAVRLRETGPGSDTVKLVLLGEAGDISTEDDHDPDYERIRIKPNRTRDAVDYAGRRGVVTYLASKAELDALPRALNGEIGACIVGDQFPDFSSLYRDRLVI
jgi:hypothetical protein